MVVNSARTHALALRLRKILKGRAARITRSKVREFAVWLAQCEVRSKRSKRFLQLAHSLPKTDILSCVSEAHQSVSEDEALWRAFLAGHFGRGSTDNSEKAQSATMILCAFGERPHWTWMRISSDPHSLRSWLIQNRQELRSLRFGNHRKYEAHKPLILYKVIWNFIEWVRTNGGTPVSAFQASIDKSPEANFDVLYRSLKHLFRFGRTGAFDLLCLLAGMSILPVRPGSCYLRGSTGPLRGARKLWGKLPPAELARLADAGAKALRIPYEVFEDALCMWQKSV